MKPTRLVLIPPSAAEDAPFLVVSRTGAVLERGVLSVAGPRPLKMTTVAVAPGADVLVRWLDLPAGSSAQQRTAALWKLADELATSPDRLVVALGPTAPAGAPRLAAVATRGQIDVWRDYLEGLGVTADVLLPDSLAVAPPEDDGLSAVVFGPAVALRGRSFAATVQPDLVDLIAEGRPIHAVENADDVQAGLIAAALAPPLNLDVRDPAVGARSWRRALVLAAAVAASPLMLIVAEAARDSYVADQREAQARELVVRADRTLATDPDAAQTFIERAANAPPPGGPVAASAALYAALEKIPNAELDILVADPGQGVKATVSHSDFGDMRQADASLRNHGMMLEETSTLQDGARIVSDVTVRGAK